MVEKYPMLVQQCVIRPQFTYLKRVYDGYKADGLPCKAGVANQCAVRMSMALIRSGFGLESFVPHNRVHKGTGACKTEGVQHVLGARELAGFLSKTLSAPQKFTPLPKMTGCAHAFPMVSGRTGILFFSHCFNIGAAKHDHIDLFDGTKYYNQIIHPSAGGNESKVGSMFAASDAVWYWQVS